MKIKTSIMYKMFLFTFLLITLIISISFAILYFALPKYYLYSKEKEFSKNLEELKISVNEEISKTEMQNTIYNFSIENNASILIFDNKDELLVNLSSPFMNLYESKAVMITPSEHLEKGESSVEFNITTESDMNELKIIFSDEGLNTETFASRTYDDTIPYDIGQMGMASGLPNATLFYFREGIDNKNIKSLKFMDISITLQPIDEAKSVILSLMPYLFTIDILISLIATYFYSLKFTQPILKISDATIKMGDMSTEHLSNVRTGDELGTLSKNLDNMYFKLCNTINSLETEINKVSQLEQSKADFMRAASHELKTPLSVLNGLIEGMIDNVGKYADRDKYLTISKDKAEELSTMVEYILSVSSLTDIEDTLLIEECDLKEMIEGLFKSNEITIKDKKLKIDLNLDEHIINTDYKLINLVFSNLIKNAIDYTEEEKTIKVDLFKEDNKYKFTIENECEIPEDTVLAKLFEPFYTLSYSRDRNKSGTGLGLYIVKRNLDTLGFTYEIEKTVEGLKFTIVTT